MADTEPGELLRHCPLILRPDPSRTVIRPFVPEDPPGYEVEGCPRAQRIADRILGLDDATLHEEMDRVRAVLTERHRDIDDVLLRRFHEVNGLLIDRSSVQRDRALLIGAYFSEEYSFEAAALFNPTIVRRPDQSDAPAGGLHFTLALRGVGEGHLSSITFRTGTWHADGNVEVDAASRWAVPPRIDGADGDVTHMSFDAGRDLSETVIFPMAPSQAGGIEDLRLVTFTEDDGRERFIGTYTAFSGHSIRQELLLTTDEDSFEMRALKGPYSASKGMSLFPRKVGGKFVMLGRQDNESIWLMRSDTIDEWSDGVKLISPRFPWDAVQMGNCGSPIEIDEGWLVITHGVGSVRSYALGACLLNKEDPSKVLARMATPLLRPSPEERDGYVPNVVYSCGALANGRELLLPYGVADNFTTFAIVSIDRLLAAMG